MGFVTMDWVARCGSIAVMDNRSAYRRRQKWIVIAAWGLFLAVAAVTWAGEALLGAALWQILVSVAAELLAFGLIVLAYEISIAPEVLDEH